MLIARTCAEGEAAHGTKVAAQLSLIGGQPGSSRWLSVSTGVLIRGRRGSGVRVPGMRVRRSPPRLPAVGVERPGARGRRQLQELENGMLPWSLWKGKPPGQQGAFSPVRPVSGLGPPEL